VRHEDARDVQFLVKLTQPAAQFETHLGIERAEGSSSSSTFGSMASARASATRCLCPPLSWLG